MGGGWRGQLPGLAAALYAKLHVGPISDPAGLLTDWYLGRVDALAVLFF